jgi:hypothetical protein
VTIADACAQMGERTPVKPSHASRVCDECGSDELVWGFETTRTLPNGNGYDVEMCARCGAATGPRHWVGF